MYKNSRSKIDLRAKRVCQREAFGLRKGTPYITWEIGRRYFLISNARPLEKNVGVTLQEEGEAAERERERGTSALLLPKISPKTKDRRGELFFISFSYFFD